MEAADDIAYCTSDIEDGMAVISSNGLIGKIEKTTDHTSTVKLLTSVNENFQIAVKMETLNP